MTRSLSIALIGCGLWGDLILEELKALGHRVRVFDPKEPKHEGTDWVQMHDDLPSLTKLRDHDALVLATPASKTATVLGHLMSLGIPTFVEKPLALHPDELSDLRERPNDHVKMMHIWRYHPAVEALAAIHASGRLGETLGLRSFRTGWSSPRRDVDSLWNLAIHDLTISKEILGHIPSLVSASAEHHKEIIRGALIVLGTRPYHWIEVSNRYERKIRELRLHGTEGVAVWRSDADPFLMLYQGDDNAASMKEQVIPVSEETAMTRELQAFLAFATGGSAPKSDFSEGADLIERLADIQRAVENAYE